LFTTVICDLVNDHKPDIFLLGASEFGKELAPRIAKRLETGLSAECISLDWDEKNGKAPRFQSGLRRKFFGRDYMECEAALYGHHQVWNFLRASV